MAPAATNGRNANWNQRCAAARLAICILLVSGIVYAAEPPPGLARKAADRETQSELARANYAFRQTVLIEEIGAKGVKAGEYRETRDIIFSPQGERTEKPSGKPWNSLVRLKLTDEDFRDLRDVQPMLLTRERLFLYNTTYRGEETVQDTLCWVLEVKPRQILDGQRLFEGLMWIAQEDYSIVQAEGRAVPQILSTRSENLFPRFRTIRKRGSEGFWFPALTVADDTLPFRTGPLRFRMRVEYLNYQKFGSDSVIRFETEPVKP